MSNKEGDLDGWGGGEKEGEHTANPNYLTSTNSYLYPETFTGIPLKIVSKSVFQIVFINYYRLNTFMIGLNDLCGYLKKHLIKSMFVHRCSLVILFHCLFVFNIES